MTGSIKLLPTAKLGSRRALSAAILALAAWVVLAGLLLAVGPAVHGEEAPAAALFQAGTASPTTGTITATAGISETPFLPPIEAPTATNTPTNTPTPTATSTQAPPTPSPTATRTLTSLPTALAEPTDTGQIGGSSQIRQHYVRGDSNVVFKWDMLVDSLALGISYAWLIGGLVVGIGLPILLIVLWNRSKRRRPARE